MATPSFAILVHLGENMWGDMRAQKEMHFDREVWNNIVDKCLKEGLDTIVLDLGEGVVYPSHPEIAIPGAWTAEETKREVARLKSLGLRIIPKLNFSAVHDAWMGIYERMVSTPEYYKVVRDLIFDAYELFDSPEYIHIGMDEESPKHADDPMYEFVCIRRGNLWHHDIKYLSECVKEAGSKVFIWGCPFMHYEEPYEYMDKDTLVGESNYYEFKKEKWTKISDQSKEVQEFYATRFVQRYGYTIEYVEEDPVVQLAIDTMKKCAERGFDIAPVSSNIFIKTNDRSTVEYYSGQDYRDSIKMYIGCPWIMTNKKSEAAILEEIELLGNAKREFYGE